MKYLITLFQFIRQAMRPWELILILFPLALTIGCRSISEEPFNAAECPRVTANFPLAAAVNVPENISVTAKFNKPMNGSSFSADTYTLVQGTTPIAGTITYADSVVTFIPTTNLGYNLLYTATIHHGVKDPANNYMIGSHVWSFTTRPPAPPVVITIPTVISTSPANADIAVALNRQITATFSEKMDSSSFTASTFTLRKGATTVDGAISGTGATASFIPSANLTPNTTYVATITNLVKSALGVNMVSNHVWTFTTIPVIVVIVPAAAAPPLSAIMLYGAYGGNAGITNQGIHTVINNGHIGTTAASTLITGFHDGTTGDVYTETPLNIGNVTGRIHTAPPAPGTAASFALAQAAALDAVVVYNSISPASKPGGIDPGAGELGGLTLAPGIYKSSVGSFGITSGDLTLDAAGDANAIWIFQASSSLTVGVAGPTGAKSVRLINGALAKNVFWYVGSAATINGAGGGTMVGSIFASAGVTFSTAGNTTQTILNGRAIGLNASVTMVNTTINVPQ
jgi:hypothetical protein